jgi:hypothetical protein
MYAEPRAPAARNERVLHPSQQMTNNRVKRNTSKHARRFIVCSIHEASAPARARKNAALCPPADRYIPIARVNGPAFMCSQDVNDAVISKNKAD